ncbi:epididymis-specific alpha-mannosidase isoform X1 [Labeo rohita]|uniref:Epididymis-specific alpha-mannosidase isoform X1 n=1 Tax=Labeo rohita TaxID=84645 RepID=A0A498MMF2_LABRO|nr:epididymis-specific alpha-mannosidase isoform X1 [Labeo rohita]
MRVRVQQDFWEYKANGDVHTGPISDNYIFTANGSAIPAYKSVAMEIVPGKVVSEIRQYFYREEKDTNHTYSVVTRVPVGFEGQLACFRLEQSYKVGPLEMNRETVFRTRTSLKNNRTLFTDNNGYQMMKRTYKTFVNNTIARNYYPMVRAAYIEDDSSRVVFLSERAHGVASLSQGQLEVMLHRRLWNNQEWNLGYNLTLNDSSVVRPVLWMMLGSPSALSSVYQQEALELQHRPVVMPIDQPRGQRKSGIDFDRILLRITHLYEEGEDPVLSQPTTINLKDVMRGIGEVTKVQERSLTGTWNISDLQRWSWKTDESVRKKEQTDFFTSTTQDFNVTIHPKEIRTFFIYFK